MEVNIKVSENAANATVAGLADAPASVAAGNASDGGAPNTNQSASVGASPAGMVDMGGPPQWLKDAIGAAGAHNAAAAGSTETGAGSGTDAGAAPSFG